MSALLVTAIVLLCLLLAFVGRSAVKAQRDKHALTLARIRHKQGYDHALSGKAAVSVEIEYQSGYRRGLERRRDLLLNDLDETA